MDNVETYVKDYGGGLVSFGGEDAYALGGYKDVGIAVQQVERRVGLVQQPMTWGDEDPHGDVLPQDRRRIGQAFDGAELGAAVGERRRRRRWRGRRRQGMRGSRLEGCRNRRCRRGGRGAASQTQAGGHPPGDQARPSGAAPTGTVRPRVHPRRKKHGAPIIQHARRRRARPEKPDPCTL